MCACVCVWVCVYVNVFAIPCCTTCHACVCACACVCVSINVVCMQGSPFRNQRACACVCKCSVTAFLTDLFYVANLDFDLLPILTSLSLGEYFCAHMFQIYIYPYLWQIVIAFVCSCHTHSPVTHTYIHA